MTGRSGLIGPTDHRHIPQDLDRITGISAVPEAPRTAASGFAHPAGTDPHGMRQTSMERKSGAAVMLVVGLLSGCSGVQDGAGDASAANKSLRSATVSVSVENGTSPATGVADSSQVQQCIGTGGTVGTKMSDPPVYQAAVKATSDQLEDARSCLTGLDFVTEVEVRETSG